MPMPNDASKSAENAALTRRFQDILAAYSAVPADRLRADASALRLVEHAASSYRIPAASARHGSR